MIRLVREIEPYDENSDMSVREEDLPEVGFGGIATDKLQVLQSAAGFYIGSLYLDKSYNEWFPYMRDSECYWKTREEANKAFRDGNWPIKF